ncbi:ATP-binding protein [Streptomyces sp. MS19]|uniref:ATP-binding protein n=1 Tax=Streptomyces sp. MS19 TaxID=3385972 RepID=UPI0039A29FF9
MAETDGNDGDTPEGGGSDHRVHVGGDATGTFIAGNHNVVIDAHGSTVNVLPPQRRPTPVRRGRVALLPRRQREPVGRGADLAGLRHALLAHGLVQVWGPPGVGKSTLLRHAAHHLEPGPDGVLFLDAAHREPGDLAQEVFEACYDAPGYAPTGPELRRLMAGIRVTVYVDGGDGGDPAPEGLRLLADAAPDATFVFASQERSLPGESGHLELRGLDSASGLRLLERELEQPLPEGERAAADELCALSLGRPLFLLRAAGLAAPDASGGVTLPRPAAVTGLLPLLLDRLDAASVRTLRLFATLNGAGLDPVHVGALCGVPGAEQVCVRLARLGLLAAAERGYRSAADVVPEILRRSPEAYPADRLCDHFARWAELPTTTPAQVADHGRALELAAALAERQGRPDLAVRLARAVSPYLAQSLRFGVWGRLLDQGHDAARRAGDTAATAYFTHEKAIRCLLIGRRVVAAALLAEAVVLWRQLGDDAGVRAALDAQQYTPPPVQPDPGTATWTDPGTTAPPPQPDPGTTTWTDPGTTAPPPQPDPGTATWSAPDPSTASAVNPGPPPGADAWAAPPFPADPATPAATAAHSSATASAGGAATGGGTAAGTGAVGTGAMGAGLVATVIGAIAAIVIGVGLYQQAQDDGSSGGPASSASGELAGVWQDGMGNVFRIAEAGDGAYRFNVQGTCGDSSVVEITGGSGSYRGTMPVWDDTTCGTTLGEADMTISLAADGASADVLTTERSDGSWECFSCGSDTWTRLS